jgi:hypothetical protein
VVGIVHLTRVTLKISDIDRKRKTFWRLRKYKKITDRLAACIG